MPTGGAEFYSTRNNLAVLFKYAHEGLRVRRRRGGSRARVLIANCVVIRHRIGGNVKKNRMDFVGCRFVRHSSGPLSAHKAQSIHHIGIARPGKSVMCQSVATSRRACVSCIVQGTQECAQSAALSIPSPMRHALQDLEVVWERLSRAPRVQDCDRLVCKIIIRESGG